jgi:hypothetical protein
MSTDQKLARSMTIIACEMGGYAVYTPEEEARAFVDNRAMRPVGAFSTISDALRFVEHAMTVAVAPSADREVAR